MDYLFSELGQWKQRLRQEPLFIFLDYDGTVVPIAETPDKAIISRQTKELLLKLTRLPGCRLAIISGRSLKNIKKIIGLKNIIYAGNHGLELEGPKIRFKSFIPARLQKKMRGICEELKQKLSGVKGVLIEDKGLTVSIHYRLADKKDVSLVKTILRETVIIERVRGNVEVKSGKKVLEVRPGVRWDKGAVVLWLLARQLFALRGEKALPVYLGDDATDEDAFRAIRTKGLAIFVGKPRPSVARYYLKNPKETIRFLRQILELKKSGKLCRN